MASNISSKLALLLAIFSMLIASLVNAAPAAPGAPASGGGVFVVFPGQQLAQGDSVADVGLLDPHPGTQKIIWGKVPNRRLSPNQPMFGTTYNNNGWLPEANCFGGHGISNTFMDHAAALFCDATDGLILNLNSTRNNSVAMTYTYWPPSSVGVVGNCAEAGQVYLQIGFGLGAPNTTAYTLSRQSCARGLGQVYNMACDNSHVDNKRGGQMDLGTYNATLHDPAFNDHLFYLVDPAPPIAGRNIYCTNYNRFVPNLENTNVLKDAIDPCYEAHLGFGGNDAWDAVPIGWKDKNSGMADHHKAIAGCSAKNGHYS
nr:hypothetical protein B0A51_07900 [Rachicladosporium sp. CCFEE 5018]